MKHTAPSCRGLLVFVLLFSSMVMAQSIEDYMNTGQELLRNGAFSEASARFRKVLAMDASNFEAQHNLAFCYLQMGRTADAVKEFKRAIQLNGKNAETWANLAIAYEGLGKSAEALQALTNAAGLDPANITVRMNLATTYANQGKLQNAIAEYRAIIKVDSRKFDAYINLARCLVEAGKPNEAKPVLNEVINLSAGNGEAHYVLGNIYWKKESDQKKALAEYKLAIQLEPSSQVYYENLGLLLEEMGKKSEAVETWKTYLTYLDDPMVKEKIQAHLDKLESGGKPESVVGTGTERPSSDIPSDELRKNLRQEERKQSRVVDTRPLDVSTDFQDINPEQPKVDLKEEAKKKASEKK